ncbi:odorant receptor 63a-like [Vespula maculifrons]|uniref:Odorant receptor n=1 Tax=Vespula maculifrons TaxID=7453 RepID=A0ABD2CBB2_VESMC
MDFFEQRYYVINKRFMSFFGMWPLENSIKSKFLFYLIIFIFFTMYLPEMIKVTELGVTDIDAFIECIPPIVVIKGSMVKAFTVGFHINHFQVLLKHIEEDWRNLKDVKEMAILSEYAESGRKFTIWYTFYISFTTLLYLSLPLSPIVLNILSPLNESRKMELLFCTEYFVNEEDYFNEILFYDYAIAVLVVAVLIATDTMYMVYSEHACGIFAIVCYRLNNIGKYENKEEKYDNDFFNKPKDDNYDEIQDEKNYQELSLCVKKHKHAIEFVELLQTCYTESLITLLLLNVVGISITGVQTIINIHNLSDVFRFGFLTLGEAFHLFFLTLPGQRIIDHSAKIFEDSYDSCWYVLSSRCKRTLSLILLRSMTPCQLMAGGLYSMTLENYVSLVQTAMSYFTVLSSVR